MNVFRKSVLAVAVGSSVLMMSPAIAEVSGNVGFMSDYFFRGVYQAGSAASAGVDYENAGFGVGTWVADVDDGIEYDLYASYSGEVSGFSYSVGYNTYNYSDDFDSAYKEIDLTVGYGPVSVEYASGTYEPDTGDVDYTFTAVTLEHKGAYIKFGSWGDGFDGDYTELGYNKEIGGWDVGVALISNDENLDLRTTAGGTAIPSDGSAGETALTFTVSKSFDL